MQRSRGKRKRQQDPERHGYRDLLDRAGIEGHLLDERNRYSVDIMGGRDEERPASADESAAVAAALGIRASSVASKGSPLTKVETAATDATTNTESEVGSEVGDVRLMKSPNLQGLESPELSGESAFGDDDTDRDNVSPSSPDDNRLRVAPNVIVRRPTGEME
jgi:hypothetical protein